MIPMNSILLRLHSSTASAASDFQQLDLERQGGSGRNHRWVALVSISQFRWANQLGFPSHLHLLHAFGPALNDTVKRKRRRLVALVGAVEFRSVHERAAVVYLHSVRRLGRC